MQCLFELWVLGDQSSEFEVFATFESFCDLFQQISE